MSQSEAGLSIALLGVPSLAYRGEPYVFAAPPRALPLLIYMLLHKDQVISRKRAAEALWPGVDVRIARTNLRRHVRYVKMALPESDKVEWFHQTLHTLTWKGHARIALDIAHFERLSSNNSTRIKAISLYRGDLCEGLTHSWLVSERERLHLMQTANIRYCIEAAEARNDWDAVVQYARRWLAIAPWREEALQNLMRAKDRAGDRAGALGEFELYAQQLFEARQLQPLPETLGLYRQIAGR